ncbi:hypothetical protein OIU74_005555, partial [Salix koriyanagi]
MKGPWLCWIFVM